MCVQDRILCAVQTWRRCIVWIDGQVEALEFIIRKENNYTNVPLKNITIKPNNLIACIGRKRQIIIPNGEDSLQVGDSVVVVTLERKIHDITDILS